MSLITVVVTLMVIGVLLWLEETYIPIAAPIQVFIRIVVIIATVIWLLNVFGLLGTLNNVRIR